MMSHESFIRNDLCRQGNRTNYTSGLFLTEPCGQRGSSSHPIPERSENVGAR